jgi:hypothetical protein
MVGSMHFANAQLQQLQASSPVKAKSPLSGVDEAEREDISTALRLAPATAQSRIDIARTRVNNLPNHVLR